MTRKAEDIVDVVPEDEKTSVRAVCRFIADIAEGTVKGVLAGGINTTADVLEGVTRLCTGDVKGAAGIVDRRAAHVVTGTIGVVKSGVEVTEAGWNTLVKDQPFLTETNKTHLTQLCQAGIYAALAGELTSEETPSGTTCTISNDACDLPGVENGVFVGDASDLKALEQAGEIPDSSHVAPEDIVRSEATKAAFLQSHGIEDASGWQVHHIRPLSEGGDDDVHNMVLIHPEDHQEITAEHAAFYGWNKKA